MIQDTSNSFVSLDGIIDPEDVFNEVIMFACCSGEDPGLNVDPARLISVPMGNYWLSLATAASSVSSTSRQSRLRK